MLYILLIISASIGLIVSISARDKYGFLLNHYTIMNIWWHMILFLSYFYSFYEVRIRVYLIFLFGLLIFNLTIIFIPSYNKKMLKTISFNYLDLKKRRMIEGSIFLLLIPYLKSFYDMITSGMELWFIRGYLGSEEGRLSYVSGSILIRFIDPIVISLIITAYYKFNLKGKRYSDKASLLFTLLAVVALGLISGGGRTVVLNWLIIYMLFVCFYFNKKTRIFLNKNAKINLFILGVPILAGIVMTILRGIVEYYNENSIIKLLARSYTFFPALFDYYLKNPDKSGFFSSNTFGLSTFENIFLLMQYPFRLISGASASGESSYLFNYQLVTSITQVNRLIGPHFLTNAQVSMYFFFFRDWGYLGIFIGPWMLAFFLNKMYEFALKDRINFLFYVYTLSQLIRTTNVSPFSKTDYLTAFIFFLLFKKFVLTKRKLAIEIEGKA